MTFRNRLAWLVIALTIFWAAWLSLKRVESGDLFLLALPFDSAPYELEVSDAVTSARQWTVPALAFLAAASLAILSSVRPGPIDAIHVLRSRCWQLLEAHRRLCLVFVLACVADYLSTVCYFHEFGITDEMHPGIKLITYAWGRSVGCLIAKVIQGGLVLLVCVLFPRFARAILLFAIVGYAGAAIWNFWAA